MSVLNNSLLLEAPASTSYQISRSLRFNSADSAYLSRTPGSAGNRKTWTWAGWVKNCLGSTSYNATLLFARNGAGTGVGEMFWVALNCVFTTGGYQLAAGDGASNYLVSTALFRDPSSWYHIVCAYDSTQATADNRLRMYVNGVEVTTWSTNNRSNITLNSDSVVNRASVQHEISSRTAIYSDCYFADVHFIDGQALTPSSFGQFDTNNVWQPKAYSGSYGTNGFKLDFADNSNNTAATLGKDTSGNGNNWTPNNLSVTAGTGNDSLVDSPTNYGTDTGAGGEVRGNYATWNALMIPNGTLSDGCLRYAGTNVTVANQLESTIAISSGKWYAEFTVNSGAVDDIFGVITEPAYRNCVRTGLYAFQDANSVAYYIQGRRYRANVYVNVATATTAGDVIGVALNKDSNTCEFFKNGTSLGSETLPNTTDPAVFFVGEGGGAFNNSANFGQRPFAYTAPSGYKALCSTNLPTPTILNGATAMDVKLYTGNGSTQTISGLGFSPDLVWVKNRTRATANHALYDTVRGRDPVLASNTTAAELTGASASQDLTAFNSDGFSLGTLWNGDLNRSTEPYVAWCWDAGSSTVTNTAGTITSQVRANPSAGFSVVTYTGDDTSGKTVGHGLGVAPQFFIFKKRGTTSDWTVVHSSISSPWNNYSLKLNTTDAVLGSVGTMDNVAPTSSVFTVSNIGATGTNDAATYVAYCFAPVSGYSAFGSYTGNGSADGPFVYTGFRPRWVMIKQTTTASATNWIILDSSRPSYNVVDGILYASTADAEATSGVLDFASNGFKIRVSTGTTNASAGTYIYAAFAENPFSISRAR